MKRKLLAVVLSVAMLAGLVGSLSLLPVSAATEGYVAASSGVGQYKGIGRYADLSAVMGAESLLKGLAPRQTTATGSFPGDSGDWVGNNTSAIGRMNDGLSGVQGQTNAHTCFDVTAASAVTLVYDLGFEADLTDFVVSARQDAAGSSNVNYNVNIYVSNDSTSAVLISDDSLVYSQEFAAGALDSDESAYSLRIKTGDGAAVTGRFVAFVLYNATSVNKMYIGELAAYGNEAAGSGYTFTHVTEESQLPSVANQLNYNKLNYRWDTALGVNITDGNPQWSKSDTKMNEWKAWNGRAAASVLSDGVVVLDKGEFETTTDTTDTNAVKAKNWDTYYVKDTDGTYLKPVNQDKVWRGWTTSDSTTHTYVDLGSVQEIGKVLVSAPRYLSARAVTGLEGGAGDFVSETTFNSRSYNYYGTKNEINEVEIYVSNSLEDLFGAMTIQGTAADNTATSIGNDANTTKVVTVSVRSLQTALITLDNAVSGQYVGWRIKASNAGGLLSELAVYGADDCTVITEESQLSVLKTQLNKGATAKSWEYKVGVSLTGVNPIQSSTNNIRHDENNTPNPRRVWYANAATSAINDGVIPLTNRGFRLSDKATASNSDAKANQVTQWDENLYFETAFRGGDNSDSAGNHVASSNDDKVWRGWGSGSSDAVYIYYDLGETVTASQVLINSPLRNTNALKKTDAANIADRAAFDALANADSTRDVGMVYVYICDDLKDLFGYYSSVKYQWNGTETVEGGSWGDPNKDTLLFACDMTRAETVLAELAESKSGRYLGIYNPKGFALGEVGIYGNKTLETSEYVDGAKLMTVNDASDANSLPSRTNLLSADNRITGAADYASSSLNTKDNANADAPILFDGKLQGIHQPVKFLKDGSEWVFTDSTNTYVKNDSGDTRAVLLMKKTATETELGYAQMSFDLGSVSTIDQFIIGSTAEPATSSYASNAAFQDPTYDGTVTTFSMDTRIYMADVYISNDVATLYDDANKKVAIDYLNGNIAATRNTAPLAGLYELSNAATGRYVGFRFYVAGNSGAKKTTADDKSVYTANACTECPQGITAAHYRDTAGNCVNGNGQILDASGKTIDISKTTWSGNTADWGWWNQVRISELAVYGDKIDTVIKSLGASVRNQEVEDDFSLRFGYEITAKNVGYANPDSTDVNVKYNRADLATSGATVELNGKTYELVDFGAVVSNQADSALDLAALDGKTKKVSAERLFSDEGDVSVFTAVVKGIPADNKDSELYARSYLTVKDADGDTFTVYGEKMVKTVSGVLAGAGVA